ncbi:MAG: NYN domain-containing protein [Candidatus Thermoplasmatota archaeon]|nr:NYN domain-containing protein [Candidatus Thermoplasmatota archaeon]
MTLLFTKRGMLGSTSSIIISWRNDKSDAIIFIDGNNFYHNSRSMGIKPGSIDFDKLINFICLEFKCNRKQVRYYNSEPDISDGTKKYYGAQKFFSELKKLGFIVQTRKLQKQSNEKEINARIKVIDDEEYCPICRPLVENACIQCVGRFSKKEKGIDVWIAIDMLNLCLLRNECDMCILVSGDGDFVPALDIIKGSGKEVASTSVYHGYSNLLREKHRFKTITEQELEGLLKQDRF